MLLQQIVRKFHNFKDISLDYKNNKDYIKLHQAGTLCVMTPEVLKGAKIKVIKASKVDIFLLVFYYIIQLLEDILMIQKMLKTKIIIKWNYSNEI